jgi:hypothetical protein
MASFSLAILSLKVYSNIKMSELARAFWGIKKPRNRLASLGLSLLLKMHPDHDQTKAKHNP